MVRIKQVRWGSNKYGEDQTVRKNMLITLMNSCNAAEDENNQQSIDHTKDFSDSVERLSQHMIKHLRQI